MAAVSAPRTVVVSAMPMLSPTQPGHLVVMPRPRPIGSPAYQAALARARARSAAVPLLPGEAAPKLPGDLSSEALPATPLSPPGLPGVNELCSAVLPSDMGLAVGPVFVLQVVNSCLTVMTKSGVVQLGFPKDLGTFFTGTAGTFIFDPRALYDPVNKRYIISGTTFDPVANQGRICFAASATSDPRGTWFTYLSKTFLGPGDFPDFPTLGQDTIAWPTNQGPTAGAKGAIYIGFNVFPSAGGFTQWMELLPKSAIYHGLPFIRWGFFNFQAIDPITGLPQQTDSLQAVNELDTGDQPRAEWAVQTYNINFGGGQCSLGCNGLLVYAIADPLVQAGFPIPEFSGGFTVPTPHSYFLSTGAAQPTCSSGGCLIETIDTRITGMVQYADGYFYPTVETSIGGGENSTLTWKVQGFLSDSNPLCIGVQTNLCPDATGAVIADEYAYGNFGALANQGSAYFGTVQPDMSGNLTMVFAYSDLLNYPGLNYVGRRVSQAPGTWHDNGLTLVPGTVFWDQLGRWGDYSGTALDVTSPQNIIWFSGMYSAPGPFFSGTQWDTAIGRNGFTGPLIF